MVGTTLKWFARRSIFLQRTFTAYQTLREVGGWSLGHPLGQLYTPGYQLETAVLSRVRACSFLIIRANRPIFRERFVDDRGKVFRRSAGMLSAGMKVGTAVL